MNVTCQKMDRQEPVGIVISGGSRAEAAPKFLAYVWAPAPDEASEASDSATSESKAA
jgi:hypothetical protein